MDQETLQRPSTRQPTWDDWNRWADDRIDRKLQSFASVLGDEVGLQDAALAKRIDQLQEQVNRLRADLAVQRALVARADVEVIDLPQLPRRRANGT